MGDGDEAGGCQCSRDAGLDGLVADRLGSHCQGGDRYGTPGPNSTQIRFDHDIAVTVFAVAVILVGLAAGRQCGPRGAAPASQRGGSRPTAGWIVVR
jgi:hypothetical protein